MQRLLGDCDLVAAAAIALCELTNTDEYSLSLRPSLFVQLRRRAASAGGRAMRRAALRALAATGAPRLALLPYVLELLCAPVEAGTALLSEAKTASAQLCLGNLLDVWSLSSSAAARERTKPT
eukprot:CAMPEP_0119388000 /NCGR_PEP_ID=MMETSP1334-20130426/103095_1 /TAXON_ID=127549 /ORGANISM="Calcidiscus leptoporus, Strain RCC1130" /LENGTH=122 /DNA_ID=CAMNT_0007409867 /DNA_START=10 /DNA_END=374 /DNA_ORIENTATION=+